MNDFESMSAYRQRKALKKICDGLDERMDKVERLMYERRERERKARRIVDGFNRVK